MEFNEIMKYSHLFVIIPLLLFIGCKGVNKEEIPTYLYIILMVLAFVSFLIYTGLINLKENFNETNKILSKEFDANNLFSTGTIDRSEINWYKPRLHHIKIIDHEFIPKFISVMKGDMVEWTNTDNDEHTIRSFTDLFESVPIKPNEQFIYTFNNQGVFNYFCNQHPHTSGSITVVSAGEHPNTQESDQEWNPYIHPLNQPDMN